jgi:phage FluMu protein Com
MNLRCAFCQTPYTLSRNDKLIALQHMETEKLSHYDTHCPRCRKATRVQRKMLEATFPNWREALHELEVQAEASPASTPKPEAVSAPKAESKPKAAPAKKPAAKKKSA